MRLWFKWVESVPKDQMNHQFIQGMLDRMCFGFFNYGHMRRDFARPDNLQNVNIRIKKYKQTGNTEFLMDASNFLMMEFSVPSHPKAHFRPTKSDESPGSILESGKVVRNKSELPGAKLREPRIQREGD